jgi:hypothetical protein
MHGTSIKKNYETNFLLKNDVRSCKAVQQCPACHGPPSVSGRHTPFTLCLWHSVRAQNAWISGKGRKVLVGSFNLAFYPGKWDSTLPRNTANSTTTCTVTAVRTHVWCRWRQPAVNSSPLSQRLVSATEFQFIPRNRHVCRHCGWLRGGNWGIRVLIPVGTDTFVFCISCRTASGPLSILWTG